MMSGGALSIAGESAEGGALFLRGGFADLTMFVLPSVAPALPVAACAGQIHELSSFCRVEQRDDFVVLDLMEVAVVPTDGVKERRL